MPMMDLMTFEDPCLLQMMDSEKDDKQEQLQTLYFCLKYAGNTSKVGQELFLQHNNVLYRMDKIQPSANHNLEDWEEDMRLMLSFAFLIYLGMLKFV
jgi:DNA-binding PucR family transcriptional regulator